MSIDKSGPIVSAAIVKEIIKLGGKPRLWCVNDDYYFCAYTASQALQCALTEWGMEPTDEDAPDVRDIHEVSDGELSCIKYGAASSPRSIELFQEMMRLQKICMSTQCEWKEEKK